MAWLELGLALVKLANLVLGLVREAEFRAQGRREALALALAEIIRKTGVRDEVARQIAGLSDAELDNKLRGLEPPGG